MGIQNPKGDGVLREGTLRQPVGAPAPTSPAPDPGDRPPVAIPDTGYRFENHLADVVVRFTDAEIHLGTSEPRTTDQED